MAFYFNTENNFFWKFSKQIIIIRLDKKKIDYNSKKVNVSNNCEKFKKVQNMLKKFKQNNKLFNFLKQDRIYVLILEIRKNKYFKLCY